MRKNVKALLADSTQRRRLIDGVVAFCCALEGHEHKLSRCPRCGYYAYDGEECFDCGYRGC
jgi:hypothetical protein